MTNCKHFCQYFRKLLRKVLNKWTFLQQEAVEKTCPSDIYTDDLQLTKMQKVFPEGVRFILTSSAVQDRPAKAFCGGTKTA